MLAIGFGEATMNTLQRLSGFISSQQIRLVTLSGGVGSYMTGIGQLNAACSVNITPAPLRASSADIARTLKNENCVKDVLLAAQAADVAIVGIGAVSQQDDATIIRSGYIAGRTVNDWPKRGGWRHFRLLFDAKGDVVTDIKIHNELIGLPLSALKTIPVRVGVAGVENKAEAIAAAMKGGYINALVTDQDTAAAILRS
ncbi:sugar-binding domain-containing protein [Escherichia coli]